MAEIVKKVRKKRTIDPAKKIAAIDRKIAALQAEKEALLKPIKARELIEEAIKTMDPEEIAAKLGIDLD